MRQEGREQVSNLDWVAWVSLRDEILLRRALVAQWSKTSSCSILWAARESILCFHRIASDWSARWRRFLKLWDRRALCDLRILSVALRSILLVRLSVCSSRISSSRVSPLDLRDDRDTSLWSNEPRRKRHSTLSINKHNSNHHFASGTRGFFTDLLLDGRWTGQWPWRRVRDGKIGGHAAAAPWSLFGGETFDFHFPGHWVEGRETGGRLLVYQRQGEASRDGQHDDNEWKNRDERSHCTDRGKRKIAIVNGLYHERSSFIDIVQTKVEREREREREMISDIHPPRDDYMFFVIIQGDPERHRRRLLEEDGASWASRLIWPDHREESIDGL